ncbi:MAG: hypothetical protein A07HB70_00227 [uncultured archaeon A07HB70]|jgi:hypothetical protein|nr:MAG: hypothetical protein A07HB70_00227 [uncultured archaeon A07HB70]
MAIRHAEQTNGDVPSTRLEVTDLRAASVAAYARHQSGTPCHFERRGGRTYLVTA